jgi:hypothetical protein
MRDKILGNGGGHLECCDQDKGKYHKYIISQAIPLVE